MELEVTNETTFFTQAWKRMGTAARFAQLVYYEPAGLFRENYMCIFCHVYFLIHKYKIYDLLKFV